MRRLAVAFVVLTQYLLGCPSSPSSHFYVLSVVPATSRTRSLSSPVQVAAVHIPPVLDRREMVTMTGANSVRISETERWSAPLDDMLRNVLAEDLVARLPPGQVILPDSPAPSDARRLVVTIAALGPQADGRVRLAGSWSLLGAGSDTVTTERNIAIDAGPAGTPDATAAAMSRALGQLADQIAAAL